MSGKTASESVTPPAAEPVADVPVTVPLQEFCAGLSVQDKRVELIAGFYSDENREQRFHDTATAYQERYEAFAIRPVK